MSEYLDIDNQESSFDFKGFLFKLLRYWKLFLVCLAITFITAYLINDRKENIYKLDSLVSIENDQNPFFTSTTSISFNWGGVSDKVETVMTSLQTRTHNEKVIDSLQYFIQYLKEVELKFINTRLVDIYKGAPFSIKINKEFPQLLGIPIQIIKVNDKEFDLFILFESNSVRTQNYFTKEFGRFAVEKGEFKKRFKFGKPINLPFFNAIINSKQPSNFIEGENYFVRFLNFDSVVNSYKTAVKASSFNKGSSVLRLSLSGANKTKIVDFLNETSKILSQTELERKNLYATNTIKFIDSSLAVVSESLKDNEDELNTFRKQNKTLNIDAEGISISDKLREFDLNKTREQSKLDYLDLLEKYLRTKTDYTNIAAPTTVGILEPNILSSVSKITGLAIERQEKEYTTREGSAIFKDIDRRLDAEKNVLLETINSTRSTTSIQLNSINKNIGRLEAKLNALPIEQQQMLKIKRKVNLNEDIYNVYQAKRGEAAVVKAANVSDINIIDEAKDIGQGPVGPNRSSNYLFALLLGLLIPALLIFIITFFDTNIKSLEDIESLSKIPVLGVVGNNQLEHNLAVFDKPKSAVSEAFRAIRSSLQFIFKQDAKNINDSKTLLVTSSISGEGKTFCSINIASVFAITNKKTVILGLDLRRPKLHKDFNLPNNAGVVNYLTGENSLEEIINTTKIENLDIICSGAIPPNPSELLMSGKMDELIAELKTKYDVIVLDTPPLGLVTDAIELVKYSNAIIYLVRQNYTKKDMLKAINDKYNKGEVKNVGYILNDYKHKFGNNYGYGYGYGGYENAYHQKIEKSRLSKIKNWFKLN